MLDPSPGFPFYGLAVALITGDNMGKDYLRNITNPNYAGHNIDRIKAAMGWAAAVLLDEPREIAKIWIDQNVGQQQKPMRKFLRERLLTCTEKRYYFGSDPQCNAYTLSREGYASPFLGNPTAVGSSDDDLSHH